MAKYLKYTDEAIKSNGFANNLRIIYYPQAMILA
jgi:hypothetical protein